MPQMVAALMGQCTAVLGLVLTVTICQMDTSLRQLVLKWAYMGWWQGLGLSNLLEVEVGPPLTPCVRPR